MSFMFKTLERLILWHLEEHMQTGVGLHTHQHAFRKGRSTETILTDVVDIIESSILRGGYTLATFMDIEGAFDNLSPESIITNQQHREIATPLLNWFKHYLSN